MIVSCPNCSTRYVLDAAMIRPPGRHVRCARCQLTWFQEPALDLGADAMVPEALDAPIADKSRMLPSPAMRAPAPREREAMRDTEEAPAYRDRQRDMARDLSRDMPREVAREQARDVLREQPRDVVREALGHDTYAPQTQPVTREISRDAMRDMSRDFDPAEQSFDQPRGHFGSARAPAADDPMFDGVRSPERDQRRERTRSSGERKRGGSAGTWALVLGGLALVMVAGIVGVQFREQIVKIEPATASLYERLGYGEINSRGLDFEGVTYAREIDNGVTVLAIRGQIVNVSDRELPVPPVRVTVRDADKRDLYQWTFTPETPKLTPKSRADFTTRLESPPPDAWDLEIRFAKAGE
ncbi:MAG TPA: hypothetical protein DCL48_00735 [Alphaproteobacteria bacterium]|nr:hypothetical protein [Alphaproteobacteria bacterium]